MPCKTDLVVKQSHVRRLEHCVRKVRCKTEVLDLQCQANDWNGCSAMACERLEWLFNNIMGKAGVVVQQ